jgi:2-hydroxychromene-2-carboxylate isomerase
MKTIHYFFDFLSPFSYFSWVNSKTLRENYPCEYYPLLMVKLFAHHQQRGPGEIPPKREFLFKECLRYTAERGIPFEVPHHIPFNPLLPLRLASQKCAGTTEEQGRIIDLLWRAIWVEKRDPESPDEMESVLTEAGFDGAGLIEKAFSVEVRRGVKENTDIAIMRNLFGVPTFCVDNELFWGNDSIPHLENFLSGKDHYDMTKWQEFCEKLK